MQYADRQNAFQREAANLAIRQRVEGGHAENIDGNNGEVFRLEREQEQQQQQQQQEQEQEQEQEQQLGPDYNDNQDDQVPPAQDHPRAIPIPIPEPGNGRRPYHALARENAEALNAFLTREIPVMTQQLQQTMELMNQLIRRQLDD